MKRKTNGYTLLEAMVTVSVLSILLATGVPALSALVEHLRATSALSVLVNQMSHARMAAVTYRRPTILCPSVDGMLCDRGGDWSNGWMVFVDRGDRRGPLAPLDLLLVESKPTSKHLIVRSSAGRSYLRYLPDGRSAGSNLTIRVCRQDRSGLGAVVVNNAGRPRIERGPGAGPCPAML